MKTLLISVMLLLATNSATAEENRAIPVLMYHHVSVEFPPGNTVISPSQFEKHMNFLVEEKYTTITISQLEQYMQGKIKLPPKTVALTFDDGWKDNIPAARLLKQKDIAGTFYIVSGLIGTYNYLNEKELQELSSNSRFEIGAHSHTHFPESMDTGDVSVVDTRTIVGEMLMSKKLIGSLINRPILTFAWPYGYYTDELIEYANEIGFTSTVLVTPNVGYNKPGRSPLKIHRLSVNGQCSVEDLQQMLDTNATKDCH